MLNKNKIIIFLFLIYLKFIININGNDIILLNKNEIILLGERDNIYVDYLKVMGLISFFILYAYVIYKLKLFENNNINLSEIDLITHINTLLNQNLNEITYQNLPLILNKIHLMISNLTDDEFCNMNLIDLNILILEIIKNLGN